ncbi:hypothetical protein [Cellulomonas fimi]|uniref:Uncharacterized protein n=1 Tax=Cellulomonas fimi TaxID=1708 RepID=A0A7Y0LWV8_CELFI|nr:hypothetical protein [Cellulomonas fimi]NMR19371.1 hypothetical protein [Cellulomonas fimi]
MTDFTGTPDSGAGAHSETLRGDAPATGPARPLTGSSLEALVRRQNGVLGADRRLSFVPAQIR